MFMKHSIWIQLSATNKIKIKIMRNNVKKESSGETNISGNQILKFT